MNAFEKINQMFTPVPLLCAKCGEVEDTIVGHPMCLKCHDILLAAKIESERAYVNQNKESIILDALERSGVPRYQLIEYKRLTDLMSDDLPIQLRKTPEKDPWQLGFYIYGKIGTGKTTLAIDIMYKAADLLIDSHGFKFLKKTHKGWGLDIAYLWLFVTSIDMISEMRVARRYSSDVNEIEVAEKYGSCEMLVIDDLGAERLTKDTDDILFAILNERFRRGVKTIITSNLPLHDLHSRFQFSDSDGKKGIAGERLASRIEGALKVIEVVGPDYRLRKNNDAFFTHRY
jgi:DNA replication protein DnaC